MKQTITLLFLLFFCLNSFTQVKRTVHVETAGTLSTLIEASAKYEITDLTLTGKLHGDDIDYIREMGGNNGQLIHLNMENALIVKGGGYGRYSTPTAYMEIGSNMFFGLEKLKTIVLPQTTREIRDGAFGSCISLENIIIPDNTFSVGSYAFERCESLEYVVFGKNMQELHYRNVFSHCPQLNYFIVSDENSHYKSIDGVLYSKDGRKLIRYPNAKGPCYTVPLNVEKIEIAAFSDSPDLELVEILGEVTELDAVCVGCPKLRYVKLPETMGIMVYSFAECTGLSSIVLPKSLYRIHDSFKGCEGLEEIYSLNPNPPAYADFSGVNTFECKVYVPKGALEAYTKAEGWRNFFHIIETDFSGIADVSTAPELKVYPNPVADMIRIEGEGIVECVLFDLSGKPVLKSATPELNVSSFPSGMYHLLVKTVRGDFYKKMIKQ